MYVIVAPPLPTLDSEAPMSGHSGTRSYSSETAAVILLVAGMQRSGSTFAFNVARDVLRARGRLYQEAPAEADIAGAIARAANAEHVLIKAHTANPLAVALTRRGVVRAICTTRRIEDAAASWMEAFGWSEAEDGRVPAGLARTLRPAPRGCVARALRAAGPQAMACGLAHRPLPLP